MYIEAFKEITTNPGKILNETKLGLCHYRGSSFLNVKANKKRSKNLK